MRRIFTLASLFFTFLASGFAQGQMDAFKLSYNDLTGTARSVSMGGAFGALGADASGVSINPAGIAVYKGHEITTTLNFTNTETSSSFQGAKFDDKKFKFSFDNFSVVGVVPTYNDDVPLVNFGFAYNKLKSFNRKVANRGAGLSTSLTDYIADRANLQDQFSAIQTNTYKADWLSTLGYQGHLIDPLDNNTFTSALGDGEKVDNGMNMYEWGDISSYDINAGTTIADMLSFGVSLSVTDINYRLSSNYYENFYEAGRGEGFDLKNELRTDGSGWQVKAGLIFKPVNELRIGVAYHSPTWYQMTDYYYADVIYDIYDASQNTVVSDYASTPEGVTDYKFRTPDKWVFSLAGVIGQYAILSADYEITNYGNMHLGNRYSMDYDYAIDNQEIKADFKNASTLRVGAEVRFTPQFSGRVGYMWQESPLDKNFKEGNVPVYTSGTVPQYSLVGDANYFTWGLGYRFAPNVRTGSHFYTDVAFVIKNRTDDFYNFDGADKIEMKTNQFTGLLTLGYRF